MNLVLIGYRGTGKTTVAQALSQRLGWSWVDADVELEARAGRTIAQIFATDGEPVFRDLESQVIADLVLQDNVVIAAGGGAILRPENRAALRSRGRVVWLTASIATILARVNADRTTAERRPQLTTQGGEAEVRQLLERREPMYRETADVSVATDDRSPSDIAAEILQRVDITGRV